MHQHPTLSKAAAAALFAGVAAASFPAAASDRVPGDTRARIVRVSDEAPATMPEAVSLLTFGTTVAAVLALLLLVMIPERTLDR